MSVSEMRSSQSVEELHAGHREASLL